MTAPTRCIHTVGSQLDRSTRSFLAAPGALVLLKDTGRTDERTVTIRCSKIFDWYAKDFEAAGGAPAFLEKHGPAEVAAAVKGSGGSVKLDYQEYDWSLNDAP